MSVFGGAWTPNMVWHLSGGPRRFGELRVDMPPISAKVLSARLRDLEDKEVLTREVMSTSPLSVPYTLTDLGEELIPVIKAIVLVGAKLNARKARAGRACP